MTQLRDKLNVIEQLLATLTGTCAPPHRTLSSSKDPPSSSPLAFVH